MKVEAHYSPEAAGTSREVAPAKLRRSLVGDLDNIVLKSLRKEPERRYATVEQFSEDIRRHLQGLPVSAMPDSLSYRGRKFARRHKVGVTATALVLLVVFGAVVATVHEARIAAAHQRRAEKRFNDVQMLANSLLFEVHDSIQNLPGATPARKLIVERALQYLDNLGRESRDDPALQLEMASAYRKIGDVQGYPFRPNLGDTGGAIRSYQDGIAILKPLVRSAPDNILDAVELSVLYRRLAGTHSISQDIATALAESQEAVRIAEDLTKTHPRSAEALEELIRDYQTVAGIEGGNFNSANLGDTAAALALSSKIVPIAEQLVAAKPNDASTLRLLASTILGLGDQLLLSGDRRNALKQFLRGKEILESLADAKNSTSMVDVGEACSRVGEIQVADGELHGAIDNYVKVLNIYRTVVKADPREVSAHIGLGMSYANFGQVESMMGLQAEGISALKTAETIAHESASMSPTAETRSELAIILVLGGEALARSGSSAAALHDYRQALTIYERLNRDDPGNLDSQLGFAATDNLVGAILLQLGKRDAAIAAFQTALKIGQPLAIPEHSNAQAFYVVGDAYSGLGNAMFMAASNPKQSHQSQVGSWQDAQAFYQQSLKIWSLVKEPGMISPEGYDCFPPANVSRQLERCRQALKRLDAIEKKNS
jgi:eukaryotic-like serine/threonine-protein kinase